MTTKRGVCRFAPRQNVNWHTGVAGRSGCTEKALSGHGGRSLLGYLELVFGSGLLLSGSCALEFSWTLNCERVLAGGVSR